VDEKLAAGKKALDQFQFVGIQSDLEDFGVMVGRTLGWNNSGNVGYANVTSKRIATNELTSSQRRRLSRLLEPDLELYAHARTRFIRDRRDALMFNGCSSCRGDVSPGVGANPAIDAQSKYSDSSAVRPQALAEFGDRRVEILEVTVSGEISGSGELLTGELVTLTVRFLAHQSVEDFTVGFAIKDRRGTTLFGSNTNLQGAAYDIAAGKYSATFKFLNRFGEGSYIVGVELHKALSMMDASYHSILEASSFNVVGRCGAYFEGLLQLDVDASVVADCPDTESSTRPSGDRIAPTLFVGRLSPPLREFSARIRQLEMFSTVSTSDGLLVPMEITNTSSSSWPTSGKRPVQLSYRWYSEHGDLVVADGLRTRLGGDVHPGTTVFVRGLLRAPDDPGEFRLVWDMVQENVRWFSDSDPTCGLSSSIRVR
jgi:hypothetical protein